MTRTPTTPSSRVKRTLTKARGILRRVEQLDSYGCWDFENTRNRELAALQVYIDLLDGPYLTRSGHRLIEEMIGWSDDWIHDAEIDDAEEE